jgi:hypothetical protein
MLHIKERKLQTCVRVTGEESIRLTECWPTEATTPARSQRSG